MIHKEIYTIDLYLNPTDEMEEDEINKLKKESLQILDSCISERKMGRETLRQLCRLEYFIQNNFCGSDELEKSTAILEVMKNQY